MRYIEINGKQAAFVALGSTDFGGKVSESDARAQLDAYAEAGGNYLDTAHVYGDFITPKNGEAEKVIGRWMSDNHARDGIFLSTKGAHHVIGTRPVGRLSREELKRDQKTDFPAIVNRCVNLTLSRTVLTSLTTLIPVVALVVFCSGQIRGFGVCMLIGVLVSTFSSIFIASPVTLAWYRGKRPDFRKQA